MYKIYLLIVLAFGLSPCWGQNSDYMLHQRIWNTTGTFGQQLGNYAFTSLDSSSFGIGILYQNLHNTGISDINISAAVSINKATLSATLVNLNTEGYNEISGHLVGVLPLNNTIQVGASLDYSQISIPTYSRQSSIDASVSTGLQFTPDIKVEFLAARLFTLLSKEELWDSYLVLRSMYRVSPKNSLCFSAEKNKTRDMTGRLLIDYRPHLKWRLLVGYQFRPNLFMLGLEFNTSDLGIGVLTSTHTQLGNNYSARAQYVR